MEIRDVVHGAINIEDTELAVVDSQHFQRLRQIKQLGFAEYSFPSAIHNRFVHSLGTMETASRAFDAIFRAQSRRVPFSLTFATYGRFRAAVRFASLLHDVGHGPLSHTTEFAMPEVRLLNIPFPKKGKTLNRKATHEDYTLKIILDSGLTPLLEKAGGIHGFKPIHVAALIDQTVDLDDDFFLESVEGSKVNFLPILRQLISSELDADRMDYLRRDSLYAGVSYGQFDFDWLVANLAAHIQDGKCYLGMQHKALYAFEDFLISRFHMFLMVYFHYKSVVFDAMLGKYFAEPDCDYVLPSEIEDYCLCDDAQLLTHLTKSNNSWARRIVEKRPYRMLLELHSGIPSGKVAQQEQETLLLETQTLLEEKNVDYLTATSFGELSKYFRKPGDPLFVLYDNHYSAPRFIPLEQCTDLFNRYSEKRSITRLYVPPESYKLALRS